MKCNVRMQWIKEIDFGDIEAKNKKEAVEIAKEMLGDSDTLMEEDVETYFLVERDGDKKPTKIEGGIAVVSRPMRDFMGMYSTYLDQNIVVKNKKGLKKAVENFDTNELIDNEFNVDFSNWNDHKIEGYWYEETVKILNTIAPFIEGYAEFEYEEGYAFRIVFKKKRWFYQRQGQIDWDNIPEEDISGG